MVAWHGGLLPRFPGEHEFYCDQYIEAIAQEYYWIEEDISVTEPTYYNVVYFEGRGDEVKLQYTINQSYRY